MYKEVVFIPIRDELAVISKHSRIALVKLLKTIARALLVAPIVGQQFCQKNALYIQ